MASRASRRVIYAAIAANLAIAACKFVAAIFTRSSAMLGGSRPFHGRHRQRTAIVARTEAQPASSRAATSLRARQGALLLFPPGRGLYFRRGRAAHRLPRDVATSPPPTSLHLGWNCALLALAAAFELYSGHISYRELLLSRGPGETIWQEIIGSKDPTIFTVFLEDCAGLVLSWPSWEFF
jgi:hypothetical protein